MKVINFFGGPGSGKSTLAAGIFHKMKMRRLNCELVTEYAKDLVWEDREDILKDQLYVFAKQNRRLARLKDKVDWAITDSPLFLSIIYNQIEDPNFARFVRNLYMDYDNINIFVRRGEGYTEIGRQQTKEESMEIDKMILDNLHEYGIEYDIIERDGVRPLDDLDMLLAKKHGLRW